MENFEETVRRVRQMVAFGLVRDDVRREILASGVTDELFFLAWYAAQILDS